MRRGRWVACVAAYREEVQVLCKIFLLPGYLPHGVGVFARLDRRLVNRCHGLRTHIIHADRPVVQADTQHRRMLRVPVNAHDAGGRRATEFGP